METSMSRKVERVKCRLFDVVILESREETPHHPKYSFFHAVTMFTPERVNLRLVDVSKEGDIYV